MPWCPKCNSEYRDGFIVCADCGCELVDEEAYAKLEAERAAAEAQRLSEEARVQYEALTGQKAESHDYTAESVYAAASNSAGRADSASMESESVMPAASDRPAAIDASQPALFSMSRKAASGAVYQDSAERASENRSSAWILLILGSLGIIGVCLGIAGILPLNFGNSYFFYGVMSAVFILFVVSGIISMKNALVFDKKAESENSLRDTMLKWCEENLDGARLDEQIDLSGEVSEEILYFRRFECIKNRLNYQFVNLDQDFLEKFIDDYVYDMIFQKEAGPDTK